MKGKVNWIQMNANKDNIYNELVCRVFIDSLSNSEFSFTDNEYRVISSNNKLFTDTNFIDIPKVASYPNQNISHPQVNKNSTDDTLLNKNKHTEFISQKVISITIEPKKKGHSILEKIHSDVTDIRGKLKELTEPDSPDKEHTYSSPNNEDVILLSLLATKEGL